MRIFFLLIHFVLFFSFSAPAAESLKADHIKIDWLTPQTFPQGSETLIGLRFRPDPHWHVYWKNPGDSGAAPKFKITAQNAEVGNVLWPTPTRLPVAHLTNLGYDGEVVYMFKVKTNSQSPVTVEAELEWLVCQEECIPGLGKLNFSRPVAGKAVFAKETEDNLKFFEQRLPVEAKDSPYEISILESVDGLLKAQITSKSSLPGHIDLFPVDPEYVLPAQPEIQKNKDNFEVTFKTSAASAKPTSLGFLLVADNVAYEFTNLKIAPAETVTEPTSGALLLVLLGSAFLGGILLNLMPCVFPVISIKAVSLLKTENSRERARDGFLYTAGVLTTFAGLGAGFLVLRNLGAAVGWGFQLQSPFVVLALIILFWLMALNFLGVFEFGTRVMNTTGNIRWQSSFGTGVLSVFVAAPCTGPFMGTALGAAATMPGYQAMLIFIFLGLGLAAPYLALTLSRGLAKKMPKPGAWMETLKEFFAFPLFATVLWLLWVLGLQTGSEGWVAAGTALLGLSFALWLGKRRKKFWKPIAWIFALLIIIFSIQQVQTAESSDVKSSTGSAWQPYSEEALSAALEKNQPVFIDFTAAWCITCQVNKKAVLETDAASAIFEKNGILRLKADWTKQDPLITKALAQLGRNSVPVYAFYAGKDIKVELLPQILTIDMIEKLIPTQEEK